MILPLTNMTCCKCGKAAPDGNPEACGCWEKCSCGWLNEKGQFCRNPATKRCSGKVNYGQWDRSARAYVPRQQARPQRKKKVRGMTADEARQAEAQWRLMYSIVVAGKSADFARGAMDRFLAAAGNVPPFRYLELLVQLKRLGSEIRKARMGNYTKLEKAFAQLADEKPDLLTATPEELERIHGVGPKTSRFAIVWMRPSERHAALDTHALKWLRFIGVDAPKSTPDPKHYAELEKVFIAEADRRGLPPRRLDALIWEFCRAHGPGEPDAWPEWLQREPAPVPGEIMGHILSYT